MGNNKDLFLKQISSKLNIPCQTKRIFLIGDIVKLNADCRGIPRGTRGKVVALQSSKGDYGVKFNFGLARSITIDVSPQNLSLVDMG